MPTTLDCSIMKHVFGTARMREVFDSRQLLQSWLNVWAALAEAEADAEAALAVLTATVVAHQRNIPESGGGGALREFAHDGGKG